MVWGFHSTYEELKPNNSNNSRRSFSRVFILPMRNWNGFQTLLYGFLLPFSFYLWGIETADETCNPHRIWGFHSTYEELKLKINFIIGDGVAMFSFYLWGIETQHELSVLNFYSCVFILPMRNWNLFKACHFFAAAFVFILPMRNWNWVLFSFFAKFNLVFILPMRNWNYKFFGLLYAKHASFHSTYEELKRTNIWLFFPAYLCFHSTYEELKPLSPKNGCLLSGVFILPMRNWNTTQVKHHKFSVFCFHSTYEELKQIEKDKRTG